MECAMKKILLTIVVLSVLFVVGCQENSITEPVSTLEKTGNSVHKDIIKMNFVIEDPIAGSSELVGDVYYTYELFNSDQPTINSLFRYQLNLILNCSICMV